MPWDSAEFRLLLRDSWDECSQCAKPFDAASKIILGRTASGMALRVGECCARLAVQIVARLTWEPRGYELPPKSSRLWRYLDFPKFVALLRDRALHFSRADYLGDRFELAKGLLEQKARWEEYQLDWFREVLSNPPPEVPDGWPLTPEGIEKRARELLRQQESIGKGQLKETYVSCWHENEYESEAFWRLYCGIGAGVAIQATCGSLLVALREYPDLAVGRIEYADFRREFAGINNAAFRKRNSLSHEREVRVVHSIYHGERPVGFSFPITIEELVERVVVSPFSPPWFADVAAETVRRFGASVELSTSDLLLEPFF